ncbi:MAG: hypothetical protein RJB66_1464 [Pseudomonadota bacterium]|jgi:5-carboxymethyl-2-hydroxymuconate isomerase
MTGKKSHHSHEDDEDIDGSDETRSLFGEALKKVFAAGVGAAFMTEENIRTYLAELKLPKEFLNVLLQQAGRSKEELIQRVGKEIIQIIQKVDFAKEFAKIAETHRFRITADIEIIKKDSTQSKS